MTAIPHWPKLFKMGWILILSLLSGSFACLAIEEQGRLFSNLEDPNFDQWALSSRDLGGGIQFYEWRHPSLYVDDPNQGRRILPNSQVRHIARTRDQLIFDVQYTIDQNGMRLNPNNPIQSDHSISLLGCSITFGIGLNDSETIAASLSVLRPKASVFNRGHPGIGTNLLLAQAEEDFFKLEKSFKESTFIYLLAEPLHTNRNAGKIPSIHWASMRPYYYLNQGKVVRKGSFSTGRPLKTWIYIHLMSALHFFGWPANASFPPIQEEDFRLTCGLVDRLRSQISLYHPNSKFLVYLMGPSKDLENDISCFKGRSIPFARSRAPMEEDYEIPIDSHPNQKATRLFAKDISDFLGELEIQ